MNAADQATEVLLSQEIESLAGCVARGQAPESYQDIVEKIRGHASKLPDDRKAFWAEQLLPLGVTLFPLKKAEKPEKKSGGPSAPSS